MPAAEEVALRSELRRLGARLRALRLAAAETQDCTAAAVAVTRSYLSEIEAGKANMTLRTLHALCRHFGVAPAELFRSDEVHERRVSLHDFDRFRD